MSRKLDVKGMSPVITTIILASTILACVLTAYFQVTGVLIAQSQHMEFQQAEHVLTSLADIIENTLYSPGSAGYVRFDYLSTRPNLIRTGLTATLKIFNMHTGESNEISLALNIVEIEGGFLVSTSWETVLGSRSVINGSEYSTIVISPLDRLAKVQVLQLNGPRIVLDFGRFKVIYAGIAGLNSSVKYNVIEVSAVNITFGTINGTEQLALIAKNTGVTVHIWEFSSSEDLCIQVKGYKILAKDYSLSEELGTTKPVRLSDLFDDFNPALPTIVRVSIFQVEISMEGR